MKRVLIEFFSGRTPENLISLLKERYDEIWFLSLSGGKEPSKKIKDSLCKVIQSILGFDPQFRSIRKKEISAILSELESIFDPAKCYQIDITGGDEIFIAAAGIWLERHKHQNVFLHQYKIQTGKKLFSYPPAAGQEPEYHHDLSVSQFLLLNGSRVLSTTIPKFSYGPLRGEVLRLWNEVRFFPKEWNDFCSMSADPSKTKSSTTQKCLGQKGAMPHSYRVISSRLKKAGILTNEKRTTIGGKDYMEFSLEVSEDALFLYEKSGNILEMYSALAAYDAGLFHDICVGVKVDWNGMQAPKGNPDPSNEIDLFLLRENLPLLISCKNNAPKNEYLYEIMIMAKHYGGYFATPMLFATGRASPTVRKRAAEMGIVLIDSIRHLDLPSFTSLIKKYVLQT